MTAGPGPTRIAGGGSGDAGSGGPRDWDGATYDRISDPMLRMGAAVVERLHLVGDERVLDAGCGSGRVTEQLAERLPRGRVIALDASEAMIAEARRRLGRFGERVSYVAADLLDPIPVPEPVDAVLSTATFHWIVDHDRLYRNLATAIRPGGRLVAQAGGAGNVLRVRQIADELRGSLDHLRCFPEPEEERRRLESAGFVDVETWLQPEPTPFDPGEPLETFLRTVCLRDWIAQMGSEDEVEAFVREVARRLDPPIIDYVRINIVATRG